MLSSNSAKKWTKQFDDSTVRQKTNSFVRFLEESSAWKNHYDFVWPLEVPGKNLFCRKSHAVTTSKWINSSSIQLKSHYFYLEAAKTIARFFSALFWIAVLKWGKIIFEIAFQLKINRSTIKQSINWWWLSEEHKTWKIPRSRHIRFQILSVVELSFSSSYFLFFLFLIYFHSWIVVIHDDQSLIIMIQFVTISAILIKQV